MRGIGAEAGKEYLEASLDKFPEAIRAAQATGISFPLLQPRGNALALARYTWEAIAKSAAQHIEKLAEAKAAKPSCASS